MAIVVGVSGGKGGTGKSTVATALAYELGKTIKVLLVDADVDCPDDHLLLAIERKQASVVEQRVPEFDFKKCVKCGLCGRACKMNAIVSAKNSFPVLMKSQCNGCGACVVTCPENAIQWSKKEVGLVFKGTGQGVDFLSGELKSGEPLSERVVDSLKRIVEEVKKDYDYVIVDTSAGTHCPVISALEMCDYVFAVTEPTPMGEHDVRIILELLKQLSIRAFVVINRSDIGDAAMIHSLAKEYAVPVACEIAYSRKIVDSYARSVPISFDCVRKLGRIVEK